MVEVKILESYFMVVIILIVFIPVVIMTLITEHDSKKRRREIYNLENLSNEYKIDEDILLGDLGVFKGYEKDNLISIWYKGQTLQFNVR